MSNTAADLPALNGNADADASTLAAFSLEAYGTMLEALRESAKREAIRLNLDWIELMEQGTDQHSAAKQALTLLKLGLFDEAWYLAAYSDVGGAGFEPIVHYVNLGDAEGRRPNAYFDPDFYRSQFGSTELRSVCALYHYALIGEPLGLKASSAFSAHRYLATNGALKAWLDKPLTHFLQLGEPGGLMANLRLRLSRTDQVRFKKTKSPPAPGKVDLASGINVIGPLDRVSGLGVSARGYLDGLRRAGFTNLGCRTQHSAFSAQKIIASAESLPPYLPDAKINLVHMNGDTLPVMIKAQGDEFLRDKYNIAVWYWELPTLPPNCQASMKYFHEFWAPTPFIARALKQSTDKPVRLLPPYLAYLADLKADVHLDTGLSHFVYCFDANSIVERKNPGALIDAFLQAFPPADTSARLTLKVTYPNRRLADIDRLYEVATNDPRIQVIDRMMSDASLHGLIGSATAYVSPHRSEGLGLTVIEAMAAGVPVISTPFGGVDTFVTADAASPIDYRLVEIEGDYIPYPRGFVWANPDRDSLASQLLLVHADRSKAKLCADIARRRVLEYFCSLALINKFRVELSRISNL